MAKAINTDSVRQRVLGVLFEAGGPMKAAVIQKTLIEEGVPKGNVHIHSHLQAFKNMKDQKVVHDEENGTYELTESAVKAYREQRGLELELVEA